MKIFRLFGSLLVLSLISCGTLVRADIVIDNFNEGGVSLFVNNSSIQASDTDTGLSTTNTVGGERYAVLNWRAGTDNTTLQINQPGDNLQKCGFGSQPANAGWFDLIYGNSTDLNLDLTQNGTNDSIGILFLFSDIAGTTTVSVTTTGLGTSTLSKSNPMGGDMSTWVWFSYSDFSAGADFSNIDKITIQSDGVAGRDTIFDMVGTSQQIPEPSSFALIGLAGVAILRWRRNKKI